MHCVGTVVSHWRDRARRVGGERIYGATVRRSRVKVERVSPIQQRIRRTIVLSKIWRRRRRSRCLRRGQRFIETGAAHGCWSMVGLGFDAVKTRRTRLRDRTYMPWPVHSSETSTLLWRSRVAKFEMIRWRRQRNGIVAGGTATSCIAANRSKYMLLLLQQGSSCRIVNFQIRL